MEPAWCGQAHRIADMRLTRVSRAFASWMAMVAILMAALAPTLSQAWAAQSGSPLLEICTANGTKWIQQSDGTTAPTQTPGEGPLSKHCPYCLSQAQAPAIPVSPLSMALLPTLPALLPTAFLQTPRPLFTWLPVQSRAPPLAS